MSKQDMTAARTAKDLEYRYQFSRAFAEVMGMCDDTRRAVEATEKEIAKLDYELSFRLSYDENDKIVSMLNASADIINIKGDRLTIESTNFYLSEDGTITATSGMLGGLEVSQCEITECTVGKCTIDDCVINDTCEIKGVLTSSTLHMDEQGGGSIYCETYQDLDQPDIYYSIYNISASNGVGSASILLTPRWGGMVSISAGASDILIDDAGGVDITAESGARINGDTIITESRLTEICNRLKALEEAQNGPSYDDCDHVSNLVSSGATETVNAECPTCGTLTQATKTTYVCSSCNAAYRYIFDGSCGHTWIVDTWA